MRRTVAKLRSMPNYCNVHIDFITWDMRNHGDSTRLNQGLYKDTETLNWFDIAMDVIQVVSKLSLRRDHDKVIGIGHSSGATAMLLAELIQPRTFDGLCGIEPIIRNQILDRTLKASLPIIKLTPKRRDTWSDREVCYKNLLKNPFCQKFHPEAIENYLKFGLYDAEDGSVKLKCTKVQEYLQHDAEMYPAFTAFSSLRSLSIPVHFVLCTEPAARTTVIVDAEEMRKQSPLTTVVKVEGTHMLPAECPDLLATEVVHLIERVCAEYQMAKL